VNGISEPKCQASAQRSRRHDGRGCLRMRVDTGTDSPLVPEELETKAVDEEE
jgi:hypothetical protein